MAKVESLEDKRRKKEAAAKMPTAAQLKKVESEYNSSKLQADEARGDMGALLKNAQNDHNVHRKAFKLALQCKNMDDTKRAEFLAHFDHYREAMKLEVSTLPLAEGE
jgi:hypothetical protein